MKFRTEISVDPFDIKIDFRSSLFFAGSCFSEHISDKLRQLKFDVVANPFGIVYNPVSMAGQLSRMLTGRAYTADELEFHNGMWLSFDHHGSFSHPDKNMCLNRINRAFEQGAARIRSAQFAFFTFGTSWVFEKTGEQTVVSNCHKLPAANFVRRAAGVDEMFGLLAPAVSEMLRVNPKVQPVWSISPVRHLRDGFFGNNLSKGRLFELVNRLLETFPDSRYFPAYEMLTDDLRDYRFYASDLVHPSQSAIDYVFEKFSVAAFAPDTSTQLKQVEKIVRAARHKPMTADLDAQRHFARKMLAEIKKTSAATGLSFEKEKEHFEGIA